MGQTSYPAERALSYSGGPQGLGVSVGLETCGDESAALVGMESRSGTESGDSAGTGSMAGTENGAGTG